MNLTKYVTGLTVTCKSEELIPFSILPFRELYPEIPLIVSDNSAGDECTKELIILSGKDKGINLILNNYNMGHGRGLKVGLDKINTQYAFIFDSDTKILKKGLIEEMLYLIHPDKYGTGFLTNVRQNGHLIKYLHPFCALINMELYRQFDPVDTTYKQHNPTYGAPFINMMYSLYLANKDYLLIEFPGMIYKKSEYVEHIGGMNRIILNKKGMGVIGNV